MLDFFRLFLALVVIASHCHLFLNVPGFSYFNQGTSSVIPFLIISGYFTSLLYETRYSSKTKSSYFHFIKDRFKKIAPDYYIYLILTFLFFLFFAQDQITLNLSGIIANLTIVPLNMPEILNLSILKPSYYDGVIPPAWYLASLLQYYLMAPFILKNSKRKIVSWLIFSLIFIAATFGLISTFQYGARFLGINIFFLTGDLIYQSLKNNRLNIFLPSLFLAFVSLAFFLFANEKIYINYNGPIIFGFLFFYPLTYFLLKKIPNSKKTKLSQISASLSYLIYLNHYTFLYIFNHFNIYSSSEISIKFARFALVTFSSISIAFLHLFIQNKLKKSLSNTTKN